MMTTVTIMTPAKPKRRSVFADKLGEFADFASGDEAAFARRGRWKDFFRGRIGEAFGGRIVLDVGSSDAALVAAMAARHPGVGFIGLDWKARQTYIGAERVSSAGLANVALLRARAQELNQIFDAGEIDEILVFHPEPCDRPEEIHNRLFSELFLATAHDVLRDQRSTLSLKTDHADYFQWASEVGLRVGSQFKIELRSEHFWNDPSASAHTAGRCFSGHTTLFERRFMKRRQPIFYLELRKRI